MHPWHTPVLIMLITQYCAERESNKRPLIDLRSGPITTGPIVPFSLKCIFAYVCLYIYLECNVFPGMNKISCI